LSCAGFIASGTSKPFARLTSSSAARRSWLTCTRSWSASRAPLFMSWKNGLPTWESESLITAVTLRL
jgi:hypothetical protein